MPKITNEMNGRPTLPSIHTLNLPMLPKPSNCNVKYEHYDNLQRPHNRVIRHERQFSTSSSTTTVSRTTSPSPETPINENSNILSPATPIPIIAPGTKLRLRPCSLAEAEAVVVISFPDQAIARSSSHPPQQTKGRGMLLFGPAVEKFRNPQRPLAKNARVHPYRFVRTPPPPGTRRSSVISITAHSFSNFQVV